MAKRRNWVFVLFGVLVLLVFLGIGAMIAITSWVQQNLEIQSTSGSEAETQFAELRNKFPTRAPLLEMRDGRPAYAAGKPSETTARTRLESLHVMAWDPDDSRLSRISVPFWLLRLKSDSINFGSYASGLDDHVDLRAEEIERYGAGIILDATMSSGERVLLWTQ